MLFIHIVGCVYGIKKKFGTYPNESLLRGECLDIATEILTDSYFNDDKKTSETIKKWYKLCIELDCEKAVETAENLKENVKEKILKIKNSMKNREKNELFR